MRNTQICMVINDVSFFLSHRLNIALEAKSRGYKFLLISPSLNEAERYRLAHYQIEWLPAPFHRRKNFVAAFFKSFFFTLELARKLEKENNTVFHLVTILPILFCGLPLFLSRRKCVFALSGLGTIFSSKNLKNRIVSPLVLFFYSLLLRSSKFRCIVQNQNDYDLLSQSLSHKGRVRLIRGSGIDEKTFYFQPKETLSEHPIFLVPARLIREKGIFEAVQASSLLWKKGLQHTLWIAGDRDPGNPSCLSEEDIANLQKQHTQVRFLGYSKDMLSLLEKCDAVLFPSYREGLPKALLEASSIGRAIVAFDVPGVSEVVEHRKTGLLAPFGDVEELARLCEELVRNDSLRNRVVNEGRKRVEDCFTEEKIVNSIFNVYAI